MQSAGIAHKTERNNNALIFTIAENIKSILYLANDDDFVWQLFYTTASIAHKERLETIITGEQMASQPSAKKKFTSYTIVTLNPKCVKVWKESKLAPAKCVATFSSLANLKGILHNHSTYSDGIHTFGANGNQLSRFGIYLFWHLRPQQISILCKWHAARPCIATAKEIDLLIKSLHRFIFSKGIESDIASDGNLDYDDEC